jgi:iron complex outermembrane receptor protein
MIFSTRNIVVYYTGLFVLFLLFMAQPLFGAANNLNPDVQTGQGIIQGVLLDGENDKPISNGFISIMNTERGVFSHSDGDFIFRNVPAGTYTLIARHIGYETGYARVEVVPDDTVAVSIRLYSQPIRGDEVRVTADYVRDDETTSIDRLITGKNLRQQLGRTIAETLSDEPGLAQRSMGPAPARPVLRGLGGDRLLILEDGGRTGDLSATASDHALAIDPMTAEHIELIRGPSALIHGSNTLGGVINVIRGQITRDMPDHIHMSGSVQGESVNTGYAAGMRAYGPLSDNFAFRVDGSLRDNRDISTPAGTLENTDITTFNGSLGLSYIRPWGMIGISGNLMDTKYGVPGGIGLADAHPNGVDIEMFRRYTELKSRFEMPGRFLQRLDVDATYSFYNHVELEKPSFETDRRIVGSEFGVLTTNAKIHLHHNSWSLVEKGLIGIWGEHRDYASGAFSETPETIEKALAAFAFQEANLGNWNLQGALRFDVRQVSPAEVRNSFLIGQIRQRTFSGFSGSASASYFLRPDMKIGTTFTRTFRAPGVEELFSEGPHLANFSFEKGNPDLREERGWGGEIFYRVDSNRYNLQAALFRNQLNNFIFPRDSNQRATRRDDLNTFIFIEQQVLMTGIEMNLRYRIYSLWNAGGSASYVRADFIDDDSSFPLVRFNRSEQGVPMIPPFTSRVFLEWSNSSLTIGAASRIAASQNRVDIFEEPTDGYVLFDLYGQFHFSAGRYLHTFSLNVDNLTNAEYRNHLSRIKSIMPEPGLNAKLLYRFYF